MGASDWIAKKCKREETKIAFGALEMDLAATVRMLLTTDAEPEESSSFAKEMNEDFVWVHIM